MPSDVTADRRCRPEDRIMQGVIPYLAPRRTAGEAADFYMRAFGAQEIGGMPFEGRPDQFIHVQLEINGGARMLTDNDIMSGAQGGTDPIPRGHLQLVVQDGQAGWDRAVGAGCMRLTLFEHQFRGDTWGLLSDRFGLKWAVLTPDPTLWDKRA
jgi:PhnB protein